MSEELIKIKIIREVPFFGDGDSLESRLRKVSLRGFPEIKIYHDSEFNYEFLTPEHVINEVHTPQLRIYETYLEKIKKLRELFFEKGIDILNLGSAYDYFANDSYGKEKIWTMLPPITEVFSIPTNSFGQMNYLKLLGEDVLKKMKYSGYKLNGNVLGLHAPTNEVTLINDGSHRIHFSLKNGGINLLKIKNMTPGFPYYAAPQKYENVQVFKTREEALNLPETKVHVIQDPGHKDLYRLFPSGGIMSGEMRPDKG